MRSICGRLASRELCKRPLVKLGRSIASESLPKPTCHMVLPAFRVAFDAK